jgi:hypothetical protein
MKRCEKVYSAPMFDVQELKMERGFSLSSTYGDYGEPGQDSGYNDSDFEL